MAYLPLIVVLVLLALVVIAAIAIGGAYLYRAGLKQQSPIPSFIENIGKAKATVDEKPIPKMYCPTCSKATKWKYDAARDSWNCPECGYMMAATVRLRG